VESRPTQKERVKTCPRRFSSANRRPSDAQGATHGQIARPGFVAPEASRLESARLRRGAGRLHIPVGFSSLDGRLSEEAPLLPVFSPSNNTGRQRRQFPHPSPRYVSYFVNRVLGADGFGGMRRLMQVGYVIERVELIGIRNRRFGRQYG
jgi:hypothetical protein